jgi:formylglycine-generating enzyme required for sulfatase activity
MRIFISYRRADSKSITLSIRLRLSQEADFDVFHDITNIPDGYDFRTYLRDGVAQCDVLLVIIGDKWASISDDSGNLRLDNPDDFVRIEVKTGLERQPDCLVLPVLVNSAKPPLDSQLPDELKALAFLNMGRKVREDDDFETDMQKIIQAIRQFNPSQRPSAYKKHPTNTFKPNQALQDFYDALEDANWEVADALIAQIERYKLNNLGKLKGFDVEDARQAIGDAQANQSRDEEYEVLKVIAKKNPQGLQKALENFWKVYGYYDPENIEKVIPIAKRQKLIETLQSPAPSQPKPVVEAPKAVAVKAKPKSLDLLPQPFAWIEIPKKGYSMGKYPVTNAQFAEFIKAGGYKNQQWWTEAGWAQREKEKWTEPRYWQDKDFNAAEQPVVGVSWYESVAFCLWLSERSGEKIMLPSEEQWQYAAQGDDGRDYPWGKQWDGSRCNNNVGKNGIGKTSPVKQYEGKGDSPFGVVDMVGNVWEWCLTDYFSQTNDFNSTTTNRGLRGGSWDYDSPDRFRCNERFRNGPQHGNQYHGFRLSRLV